jgi:hypothetical protein
MGLPHERTKAKLDCRQSPIKVTIENVASVILIIGHAPKEASGLNIGQM